MPSPRPCPHSWPQMGTAAQGPQDSSSAQSTSCSQRRGSVLLPRSPSRKPPPGPGLGPLAVDTWSGAAAALHLLSLAGQPSALPATPRNPDQQIQQGLLKEQERVAQEASPSPSTALQEPGSGLSPETLSSEMLHLCRHLPGMALEHPKWSASKPCPTPASPSQLLSAQHVVSGPSLSAHPHPHPFPGPSDWVVELSKLVPRAAAWGYLAAI